MRLLRQASTGGLVSANRLSNIQNEDGSPVAGATEGNQRATTHGAQSKLIEARARELVPQVYEANKHLDQRDGPAVSRYAATLARIERIYCWLSEQSDPVFANGGNAHLVYGRLERWERMASECERDLAISPRERAKLGLDLARGDSMVSRMQGGIG